MKNKEYLSIAAFLVFIAALIFYYSGHGKANTNSPHQKISVKLQPQMKVKPVVQSLLVGCQSNDLLHEFVGYAAAGESAKAKSMFARMECAAIPPEETYKVLSVTFDSIEFANVDADVNKGMWATLDSFGPVHNE